ncbi:MAG: hypothetical protein ACI4GY_10405 [Acutalibacteraceae bacterium]
MNKCPKCGEKLSPFYFKQLCPKCGANLMYYDIDERLKQDAEKAQKEVEAVNRFTSILKNSSVASPLHIIRLVLFFTPLASMCLPMFVTGNKTVSLVELIMSIIKNGLDFNAMLADTPYFLGVLSMVLVIVLSLAEIIVSLFSATKHGLVRNLIFSAVNLLALCGLGIAVFSMGGKIGIGFILTLVIYLICDILHFVVNKKIRAK